MKKYLVLITLFSFLFGMGCVKSKSSALDRLKQRYSKGVVDSMKLPERKDKDKSKIPERSSEIKAPRGKGPDPKLAKDLSGLGGLPEKPEVKQVKVAARETAMRAGPGNQFKRMRTAQKGERFPLLRVIRGASKDQTWYMVKEPTIGKAFVSSLFTEIEQRKEDQIFGKKTDKDQTLRNLQTVVDPTPPLPSELIQARHITLNFEDTEIYDVITTFAELLKLDYIIEGPISGKITLQTFNKIPVSDLYSVLEQILALHNITVVRSGNFYRFLQIKDAVKKPLSIYYGSAAKVPDNERLIIQIIPLKHISAESMKKIITPLLTKNASFIEIPETNNLMMIEMASNVKRIIQVVQALDIDKLASSDINLYEMKHTDASVISEELREIFSTLGFEDALGNSLSFLPIARLNSILVVNAFDSILPTIEFWIEKLDQPILQAQLSTFVYYVQNGDASKLAAVLTKIFAPPKSSKAEEEELLKKGSLKKTSSKEKPKPKPKEGGAEKKPEKPGQSSIGIKQTKVIGGVEEGIEGLITIISDADTNSIIIRTNPRNYPSILEVIKKLDLMPQQVLIEVLILELELDDETREGLEWAIKGKLENATFTTGSDVNSSLGASIAEAGTGLFATPGYSFFVGNPDKLIALLQAFASDSKLDILSNPILVTSDNKSASLSITNEIPIESTTITTPTAGQPLTESTIEFRSVGVKLNISPKINTEKFVTLKINQEISQVDTAATFTTPSFLTRSADTEVVLKDNQILVMGGLIEKTYSESASGIPKLRDIPYIGKLFGATERRLIKRELMIFITPHVMSDERDTQFVTHQFKNRLLDLNKSFGKNFSG